MVFVSDSRSFNAFFGNYSHEIGFVFCFSLVRRTLLIFIIVIDNNSHHLADIKMRTRCKCRFKGRYKFLYLDN